LSVPTAILNGVGEEYDVVPVAGAEFLGAGLADAAG
jgi:hypothetical protein